MKKVFMLLALLCCTLSGFAEKKPIELTREKQPHGRSEIKLPTAYIDGQLLTISFVDEVDFSITVTDASNTMVYVGTHITRETTIPLPQLPEGNYYLRIEDEEYTYCGKLEIE